MSNKTIYLKDYQPPAYVINRTDLNFELEAEVQKESDQGSVTDIVTIVKSRLEILRTDNAKAGNYSLRLHGQNLDLQSVQINGQSLTDSDYTLDDEGLTLHEVPWSFVLETEVWIKPEQNKALEGLYQSSGNFCTQCEAEGFRRITYYLDQPDICLLYTSPSPRDEQ